MNKLQAQELIEAHHYTPPSFSMLYKHSDFSYYTAPLKDIILAKNYAKAAIILWLPENSNPRGFATDTIEYWRFLADCTIQEYRDYWKSEIRLEITSEINLMNHWAADLELLLPEEYRKKYEDCEDDD
jgi:hypothetical protein